MPKSPSDLTPLTRADIPAIVSAVLHSIKSTDAQEDDEPSVSTLPGQSCKVFYKRPRFADSGSFFATYATAITLTAIYRVVSLI